MTVKLVVIYPRPLDIEAFETVYNRDHVPMAVAKLPRKGHHLFIALQRSISPPWRLCKPAPHRTVANRRSRMQLRFLPAAHRSSWSPKSKYSGFKKSDLSAET